MNIYLAELEVPYEGTETLGVFATFEEAETFIRNDEQFQKDFYGEYYVTPVVLGAAYTSAGSVLISNDSR